MAFKILHTSDWHLGKRLYKAERLDEQKLFLDWTLKTIKEEDIELLLIAGDIFDTPFPPTTALAQYFDFLRNICDQTDCQVAIIAGNHDSGRFLEAPLPFLKDRKISIFGQLNLNDPQSALKTYSSKSGELIELFCLPFFRSHELEEMALKLDTALTPETLDELFDCFFTRYLPKKTVPRLLMAHHQFGNFEGEGSELALSISGINSLPLTALKKHFDYGAFGHIHKSMTLSSNPHMVYSGSPIPWRFSEIHEKKMFLIQAEEGKLAIEKQTVPTFRKLLRLQLNQATWENDLQKKINTEFETILPAYAEVHIRLETPSHEIAEKIRLELKKKEIELLAYHVELNENPSTLSDEHAWRDLSLEKLLGLHYKEKYQGEECPDELIRCFRELLVLASEEK